MYPPNEASERHRTSGRGKFTPCPKAGRSAPDRNSCRFKLVRELSRRMGDVTHGVS